MSKHCLHMDPIRKSLRGSWSSCLCTVYPWVGVFASVYLNTVYSMVGWSLPLPADRGICLFSTLYPWSGICRTRHFITLGAYQERH